MTPLRLQQGPKRAETGVDSANGVFTQRLRRSPWTKFGPRDEAGYAGSAGTEASAHDTQWLTTQGSVPPTMPGSPARSVGRSHDEPQMADTASQNKALSVSEGQQSDAAMEAQHQAQPSDAGHCCVSYCRELRDQFTTGPSTSTNCGADGCGGCLSACPRSTPCDGRSACVAMEGTSATSACKRPKNALAMRTQMKGRARAVGHHSANAGGSTGKPPETTANIAGWHQ